MTVPSQTKMSSLEHLSRFLHLYPLNYEQRTRNLESHNCVTVFIVIIVVIGLYVWNYMKRITIYYCHVDTSYGVIEVTINLILTILNVIYITIAQTHKTQWRILFHPLHQNRGTLLPNTACFIVMHLLFLILPALEAYITSFHLYIWASICLIDEINLYILLISVLLINSLVKSITKTANKIKADIEQEMKMAMKLKGIEKNGVLLFEMFMFSSNLDNILHNIVDTLKAIDAFNVIYGVQILGIASVIMLFVTETFNNVFYFVALEKFTIDIILKKCYYSFFLVVLGMLVISPCFEAANTFDGIIKVVCKLLVELPHGLDGCSYKFLRNKLLLLVKQLEFKKPYFSAAGFIEVNFGMFMYIFGAITSFVVVYVQLKN